MRQLTVTADASRRVAASHHADVCGLDPVLEKKNSRINGDDNGARLLFVESESRRDWQNIRSVTKPSGLICWKLSARRAGITIRSFSARMACWWGTLKRRIIRAALAGMANARS